MKRFAWFWFCLCPWHHNMTLWNYWAFFINNYFTKAAINTVNFINNVIVFAIYFDDNWYYVFNFFVYLIIQEERVLFHYIGHGVPKPTTNGEIWVFNKVLSLLFRKHCFLNACLHYVYLMSYSEVFSLSFNTKIENKK